jgi:F-type H+-transporting ATPase subunit alpha
MKQVAGKLRLELAQYRELAAFAQFGTGELDKATKAQLERGQRLSAVLKQPQFVPVSLERQIMILYAAVNGYLDDITVDRIPLFEAKFYQFMDEKHSEIVKSLAQDKKIGSETEKVLIKAINEFKELHNDELF